ncbi:MAG: hypothetical protein ACRYG7_27875 [Janthinobacterium lividum]
MRFAFLLVLGLLAQPALAQVARLDSSRYPRPVVFTAAQDQENMLRQLGIRKLRPGPSGDAAAPNHANYDEALANPCPRLPDALVTKAGRPVTTPAAWWQRRRPEIVEDFEREVYGRIPKNTPRVT